MMLHKFRKLYRSASIWSDRVSEFENTIEAELLETLSPIDRFIVQSGMYTRGSLFNQQYDAWRVKRINKILEIYGIDGLKGRSIVELGCGHGDIGAFLADLGAKVLCLDGRIGNVNFARLKHRKVANIEFREFNLEKDFSGIGKFDIAINFGPLYHINNVEDHLRHCFNISDDVLLETVVLDSLDPNDIVFCKERGDVTEEAVEGVGSRPSPFYVERVAEQSGFRVSRYFTKDLNAANYFDYDWEHQNNRRGGDSDDFRLRRFWRFQKG
jgi:SAM-dependent methyltransferase